MSHNAGRVKPKQNVATQDASYVRRLKEAGVIPLLVSNSPELCMCWETFNNVTGCTKNPYDLRRTSGGSSGGEVCALIILKSTNRSSRFVASKCYEYEYFVNVLWSIRTFCAGTWERYRSFPLHLREAHLCSFKKYWIENMYEVKLFLLLLNSHCAFLKWEFV